MICTFQVPRPTSILLTSE